MIYYNIVTWVSEIIQSVAWDNYDDFQHVNFIILTNFHFTIVRIIVPKRGKELIVPTIHESCQVQGWLKTTLWPNFDMKTNALTLSLSLS
jgi:hypothetical protein